jgi:sporulation protein YlmC with PRC-barrel domain
MLGSVACVLHLAGRTGRATKTRTDKRRIEDMNRTLTVAAIVALFAPAAAFAQSTNAPNAPMESPSTTTKPATQPNSSAAPAPMPNSSASNSASPNLMTTIPANSVTVTEWYKQNVYDSNNSKIGDINDVLVSQNDGKITAVIVGVGGFLGMGEKNVAVSFNSVQRTMKDNKEYLTLNTTKDALKSAAGYKYDRTKMTWLPEDTTASTK